MLPLLRYTLDLFESFQAPAHIPIASNATKNVLIDTISSTATLALADQTGAPAPDTWAPLKHPKANRECTLSGFRVAYWFQRSRRRSVGFSVGLQGLAVRAPSWLPLRDLDVAVQAKADWILRTLQDASQRENQRSQAAIVWRDGAQLSYLGQPLQIRLDPEHRLGAAHRVEASGQTVPGASDLLCISLPHHATTEQIRDAVQAWLMRQARQIFLQRLDHFAPLLGVQWKKLGLSRAGTRWGSASRNGAIRLNWRLLHFDMALIDYVVVHELSHLREMNHSPRFWTIVGSLLPDYAQLRQRLKTQVVPPW
jgi:predicted metal-dependent hydrolase